MNRGYVRLWRKSLDAGWIKNHKLWAFWCWCLMKASHKEKDILVGLSTVRLMPGQFVFGRKSAARETALSEREVRTVIHFLEKSQNVTIKTTNKYSIITIINWNTYQQNENENDQQNDQQVTSKRPASDQQVTTNKNVKNVKNVKKKNIPIPDDFEISENVRAWAVKNNYVNLEAHLESFKLTCLAKGYQYQNWDAAFMNAVRDNWAKIGNSRDGTARPTIAAVKQYRCGKCGKTVLFESDLSETGCIYCEGKNTLKNYKANHEART